MDYQVKPLGKKCAGTGADLVPGTVCRSVLVEQEGELVRLDFSPEGWKGPPPHVVGMWKSVVPIPAQTHRNPLDPAHLMSFFEELTEEANPVRERLRYILALLLVQKRRLRVDGSTTVGEEAYLQLSGTRGEGAYEVRDFVLSEEEVEALQAELNAHLVAELAEPSESLPPFDLPISDGSP